MKISLVIPAYNEEKNIESCLIKWSEYLGETKYDYEIIVSEDGSTDGTYEIAKRMASKNKRIKVFHSAEKLGKGGGIINGFKKASGDIVAFTDADLSAEPIEMGKLIKKINSGYDVAIGSRAIEGSKLLVKSPIKKRIFSKALNMLVNTFFGLKIKDSQCGFKAFSRKALNTILPQIKTKGFEIDIELLLRSRKAELKIAEVPVKWAHKKETTKFSMLKDIPKMAKNISKLWISENFNRIDLCFLLFMIAFFAVSLLFLNTTPTPDEGTHNLIALYFHNLFNDWIKNPTFSFSKIYDYTISYLVHYPKISLYYPPLFHIILSFFYRIFGVSFWAGGLLTLIFLVLTSISIYAFCKKFINRRVGFLSAALFSFSPLIFFNSIRAMTDIPYMLFLVLTIYEFLKALESGEKKHFIFSAILFSIGFLIKWNVVLIIPMIFLYALIDYRSRVKKLIFSFLLIAVILSPYLLLAIKAGFITVPFKSSLGFITVPFKSSLTGSYVATQDPQFTSTGGWVYYFEVLWNQYLTIPIFILAIVSFVLYCIRRERLWKLLLLWFLTYYLVFTIIPNKEDRYILPAVIPMIIPLSYFVMSFKKSLSILFSVILILILVISSYMILSQSNQYKTDFDMIVKTLDNGSIALATEPSWFYSSEFMFRLAALDENMTKIVFRPCSFSSISINNMIDSGVNYFIVAEPTEDRFTENVNLVKTSSYLYLFEKIETKNSSISIYAAKGYTDKKFDKICNYVCILQDWICTKYIKPSEALI